MSWTLVFALWNSELCAAADANGKSKVQSTKIRDQIKRAKDLSQQKMQRGFAKADFVPAVQHSWLARREPDGIVNHSAVD